VFQTKQPLRRKPPVGPPSAVGLAQPVAGPFLPFAQHRPQASPQPAVRTTQARTMALPEVAVPAPQDGIGLRNDLAQASSVGAPRQRSHFLLQFLKAFLPRPLLPSAKVPAQKVEAFTHRVDDARPRTKLGLGSRVPPLAPPLPGSHAQAETRNCGRRSRAQRSVRARSAQPLRRSDRALRVCSAGASRSSLVSVSRRAAPLDGGSVWCAVPRAAGPVRSRRVRRTA